LVAALLNLLGAALILAALRDIFHELFHPSGRGSLSRATMRGSWRLFCKAASRSPAILNTAGPAIMVLVIAGWTAMLLVGWALILWPHLPEGFLLSTGLAPSENGSFVDALYLSLTTLTTLGYGDITPVSGLLRVLLPLEALVGFGLLTVSIPWVLSIYPVLSRRRTLAQRILFLCRTQEETGVSPAQTDAQILASLTSELTAVRNDLIQFPITYYFHGDENDALSATAPYLLQLSNVPDNASDDLRLHASTLRRATEAFADTLCTLFPNIPSSSPNEVLEAYARDHLHPRRSRDKRKK
jgi:voltage-gated potassium channel Kch